VFSLHLFHHISYIWKLIYCSGRHGGDHIVVAFTTTCITSAYHHLSCEFESRSWRSVLIQHYVIMFVNDLGRQVSGFLHRGPQLYFNIYLCTWWCENITEPLWFSLGTLVSSTNKTDRHDVTKILLKVVLSTITLTLYIVIVKSY
jgi:hypothetical protein